MAPVSIGPTPFSASTRWIWVPEARNNHYALFCRDIGLRTSGRPATIVIAASYHYELFVNGRFLARGPVHGDPSWCHYDEVPCPAEERTLRVAIVVHHSAGTYLHYLTPAPAGLIAEVRDGEAMVGTDASWSCITLPMWREDVRAKGWALGYCEDYDASREPPGWQEKSFPPSVTAAWPRAKEVEAADSIWGGWQEREVPVLHRRFVEPRCIRTWEAPGRGPDDVFDISRVHDEEELRPRRDKRPFTDEALHDLPARANALTLDLGAEHVGFITVDLDAPAGTVIELSGAELLSNGRPWVFRKGVCNSARYRCRAGRQRWTSFSWSGFRYIHAVVRGSAADVRFHRIGCTERKARLDLSRKPAIADPSLARVFDLCQRTLEVGVQELTVDCPTREQAAAWADSLWIAWSVWCGHDEPGWMKWYLEAFVRAPLNEHGLINGRYPGTKGIWLDFCLIPLIGQRFHRERTGAYYRAAQTVARALEIKRWFDAHRGSSGPAAGLVDFDFRGFFEQGLRNFIDHPGLGMHDAPHPGIDRDGCSCPLNCFYMNFVDILADMTRSAGRREEADELAAQGLDLRRRIRGLFFDGEVWHDAWKEGLLTPGTSWQTNGLAVWCGLSTGREARSVMRRMLEGYDRLCRCTPYFHFYFLPALRIAGLEAEAREIIVREWGPMLERDATTTWEGFQGDSKDSLCHPFSTAPFLFLLEDLHGRE